MRLLFLGRSVNEGPTGDGWRICAGGSADYLTCAASHVAQLRYSQVPLGYGLDGIVSLQRQGETPSEVTALHRTGSALFVTEEPSWPVTVATGEALELVVTFSAEESGAHTGRWEFVTSEGTYAVEFEGTTAP